MSARVALATALLRHIEGDDMTRDLITADEWDCYLGDAAYVADLLNAAGFVVVRLPERASCANDAPDTEWAWVQGVNFVIDALMTGDSIGRFVGATRPLPTPPEAQP